MSDWLVLVSYVGRRSGQRYTFPVAYARRDGALLAVTPSAESSWWRNFREPRQCTLWVRGTQQAATGTVVTGDEREALLVAYVEDNGAVARLLGVDHVDPSDPERFAEATRDLALVRFTVAPEH